MEIILANNGVEKFIPNLNQKIFDIQGCEPSQITEKTNDENKINIIHSVLKPGYKVKINDKLEKIIKETKNDIKLEKIAAKNEAKIKIKSAKSKLKEIKKISKN